MKNKRLCTVLLVDDSHEDIFVCTRNLQLSTDCIYTVLDANDTDTALQICKQVDVDCVLLDHNIPGCNSLDLLTALKKDNGSLSVPVVMVTGQGSERVAVEAMKAGAIDYLSKDDITPESLFRVTQNALDKLTSANKLADHSREMAFILRELKESEDTYRMLVSSISEYAIVKLNESGEVSSWNEGARRLFDYHDHEIIGDPLHRLLAVRVGAENAAQEQLNLAKRKSRYVTQQWMVKNTGQAFLADFVLAPVFGSMQQLGGYSLVVRDVQQQPQGKPLAALHDAQAAISTPVDTLQSSVQALLEHVKSLKNHKGAAQKTAACLQLAEVVRNTLLQMTENHGQNI